MDFYETREESYEIVSNLSLSCWDKFKIKYFPHIAGYRQNKGLLYSFFWFNRRFFYNANNEEFFAYQLHPEDVNFNTQFYKENRIKLTLIQ